MTIKVWVELLFGTANDNDNVRMMMARRRRGRIIDSGRLWLLQGGDSRETTELSLDRHPDTVKWPRTLRMESRRARAVTARKRCRYWQRWGALVRLKRQPDVERSSSFPAYTTESRPYSPRFIHVNRVYTPPPRNTTDKQEEGLKRENIRRRMHAILLVSGNRTRLSE